MALESIVFPRSFIGHSSKESYSSNDGCGFYEFGGLGLGEGLVSENGINSEDGDRLNFNLSSSHSMLQTFSASSNVNSSPSMEINGEALMAMGDEAPVQLVSRRKRRRIRSSKNKEEVENQRLTHIAVERNRRKQMNEYLAVLRSLMPSSYAQRGDQASIVGGAINFVKELEQLLQTLEAQKHAMNKRTTSADQQSSLFSSFFTFPQYSTISSLIMDNSLNSCNTSEAAAADIEVMMIESHINLKVRARRQPKQLIRMLVGLQSLWLTPLHLNVTTASDQMALYSFSLKVENDSQYTSVDEIAAAVHQMVRSIQNENTVCC